MGIKVAILSDTHIPSRARELPDSVAAEIRAADHTIHTGIFDSPSAYERVDALADGELTGSATGAAPATEATMLRASVTEQGV